MRTFLFMAALVVAIRLATFLPAAPTVMGYRPPYVVQAGQSADLASLLVAFCVAGLPILGVFAVFRSFNRWHRGFHASMKAGGVTGRGRDSGR